MREPGVETDGRAAAGPRLAIGGQVLGGVGGSPLAGGGLVMSVASAVRYRFFLYAGLLPYFLGAAWALRMEGAFRPERFWLGLLGIGLAVVGVESFNEYFDARMGTDRVFDPSDDERIPTWMLWLGVASFAAAACVGLSLATSGGWPVLLYMGLGGAAAAFYVGPPFRWAYRGLGETSIALSYGPWMTLGSIHLHTGAFSWRGLAVSLVPGLLVAALAVVNEIPDFHQDRLVGKRNLVVRLGRRNGVSLYLTLAAAGLVVCVAGAVAGWFPVSCGLAGFIGLPFWFSSARTALKTWDTPREFVPAVRDIVLCYLVSVSALIMTLAMRLP
ncbi:MAG: prenyltransferase [Elusimicrobia bacterium]|nr:prenyltransferase [Elusimicrobiota bacterium]